MIHPNTFKINHLCHFNIEKCENPLNSKNKWLDRQQVQQSVFKGNLILYLIADNHAARPGTKRVGHLVGYVLIT